MVSKKPARNLDANIRMNGINMQTKSTKNTIRSVIQETLGQSTHQKYQTTTCSVLASLVSRLASQEKDWDLKTPEGHSFLRSLGFSETKDPDIFSLKMLKGYLVMTKGKLSRQYLGFSPIWYEYQWQVLNSKNFGVPQNRERVFIIGHLREKSRPKVFPIGESYAVLNKKKPTKQRIGTRVSSTLDARYGSLRNSGETYLHYIGGITGKRDMWIKDKKQNSRNFSQGQRVYAADGIASTLAGNAGGLGGKTGLYAIPVLTPDRKKKRQNGRRFKTHGEPAFTLTSQDRHGVFDGLKIRRLTPTECERLQGFPDGWTEELSDTQRYKCLGNAVTTTVVTEIAKLLIKEVNHL